MNSVLKETDKFFIDYEKSKSKLKLLINWRIDEDAEEFDIDFFTSPKMKVPVKPKVMPRGITNSNKGDSMF